MKKETFIDNMTERGYELKYSRNGNITATKGANTVRYVPLADYIVCVSTPTMTDTPAARSPNGSTRRTGSRPRGRCKRSANVRNARKRCAAMSWRT